MNNLPDIEQFAVDRLPPLEQMAEPVAAAASVPARRAVAKTAEKSLAQTILDPIQAYLRGTGQAATAGLAQYPAALGIQATRAVTGGAPLTFGEALQEVKSQNRQFQQEYPTAYMLGQLSGITPTIATGGAAAGGIPLVRSLAVGAPSTSIPAMAARGAMYGGVQGFTENEALSDAAAGATLGAALSGTLGTAGRYATSKLGELGEKSAVKRVQQAFEKDPALKEKLKSRLNKRDLTSEELKEPLSEKEVRKFLRLLGQEPEGPTKELVDRMLSSERLAQETAKAATRGFAQSSPVYGALAGLGAGGAIGIQDPLSLALLAGAGGLGVAKSQAAQEAAQAAITRLGIASMTRPGVGNLYRPGAAGVPGALVGEALGRAGTAAIGPYVSPPSRLQLLADDFRQQYGER